MEEEEDFGSFNDSSQEEPEWSDDSSDSGERNDIGLSVVHYDEQGKLFEHYV